MAKQTPRQDGPSGLDELRSELGGYLGSVAQGWLDKAGDKIGGLTDRLNDLADGDGGSKGVGGALGIGKRMLGGESPLKAIVGQKSKDMKDKTFGKVKEAFGGGGGGGGGKSGKGGGVKAVNIVEKIDVGVPLRTAYDHWTRFEEFSGFMKGVRNVSRTDEDVESDWQLKVGPSSRGWKAKVQEQVPDDRISWTSEGAKGSTRGIVTFHKLGPTLTRVLVFVEYSPAGFFEKTGNVWRAQGRRLRLDLKHFGRHVMLHADEEIEGWRGEIRDGEIVRSHEEGLEDDERPDEEEPEGLEDEEEGAGGAGEEEEEEEEEAAEGEDGQPASEFEEDEEEYDEEGPYEDEDEDYDEEDEDEVDEDAEDEDEDYDEDDEEPVRDRRRGRR